MTPRFSGQFTILGLAVFVLKSLLGITRQWSLEKFAILILKAIEPLTSRVNHRKVLFRWIINNYSSSPNGLLTQRP